jgi:organic hydroperoxide reductase OsmC/OhrA
MLHHMVFSRPSKSLRPEQITHAWCDEIEVYGCPAKAPIDSSSDPAFRGDPARWNPDDLRLASISACHEFWYLSLCAAAGIVVLSYSDEAEATMAEDPTGAGFVRVTLRPFVTIQAGAEIAKAVELHHHAHKYRVSQTR